MSCYGSDNLELNSRVIMHVNGVDFDAIGKELAQTEARIWNKVVRAIATASIDEYLVSLNFRAF